MVFINNEDTTPGRYNLMAIKQYPAKFLRETKIENYHDFPVESVIKLQEFQRDIQSSLENKAGNTYLEKVVTLAKELVVFTEKIEEFKKTPQELEQQAQEIKNIDNVNVADTGSKKEVRGTESKEIKENLSQRIKNEIADDPYLKITQVHTVLDRMHNIEKIISNKDGVLRDQKESIPGAIRQIDESLMHITEELEQSFNDKSSRCPKLDIIMIGVLNSVIVKNQTFMPPLDTVEINLLKEKINGNQEISQEEKILL